MKKTLQLIGCAVITAVALFSGVNLKAQDPPPPGGFKNPYLSVNRSGKVVLTYSRWDEQVKSGTYTLVSFWASWSDEAREEAPYVQSVYKKYAGKVKVLGVPFGDEIQDSMDAMVEWGITYPQLVDVDEDLAGPFAFDSIPYIVLLGPDRKPVASNLHGEEIEKAIQEALK